MNFEPQKFFIGLVDFFAVLMPGALLTYLIKDQVARILLNQPNFVLDSGESWIVFLFISYLLGHFVFLVGSVLDELVYDPLRMATDRGQIARLAAGRELSSRELRAVASSHWFFGKNADNAVIQAERIKARALHALSAENAINVFQWCKARLSIDHPEGLVAVQRFEADSKFFRSFVVVLGILVPIFILQKQGLAAVICALLVLPALWRYMDQRFKATQQAYWFIITLEAKNTPNLRPVRSDGLTHAGGVVSRLQNQKKQYLLVQASDDPDAWVLPKGHIEAGENPRETAVREIREETSYWAKAGQWLDDITYNIKNETLNVRFYQMEIVDPQQEQSKSSENRRHQWLSIDHAIDHASHPETKALLKKLIEPLPSAPQPETHDDTD